MKLETFLERYGFSIEDWSDLIKTSCVIKKLALFRDSEDCEPDVILDFMTENVFLVKNIVGFKKIDYKILDEQQFKSYIQHHYKKAA